jgi:hypothetical protein
MDLAYGDCPPDLATRVDLDPALKNTEPEAKARDLTETVEGLLTEAQCMQETAEHMIEHLQANPEAAAAVALTLAELSAILAKLSPGIIVALKAASPAVWALLASPQFLIAAGLTVGVTVVMFGGWKIVKRIINGTEAQVAAPMAFEANQGQAARAQYPQAEGSVDEAVDLEEELSTIESWRRGIPPPEFESADAELMSPSAFRSEFGDDARTIRSARTSKTHKSHKAKSHKGRKEADKDSVVPERKSSKKFMDGVSEVGSHRSHQTSKSKMTVKSAVKSIEDGSKDKENGIDGVLRLKKDNMLKTLFKKKKDREERGHRMESTLVAA